MLCTGLYTVYKVSERVYFVLFFLLPQRVVAQELVVKLIHVGGLGDELTIAVSHLYMKGQVSLFVRWFAKKSLRIGSQAFAKVSGRNM